MRIAMSVCVYYSFDHLFPQHGWGCWEKWELQCLCVYIITLITYFPNMEGGGGTHGNENSNVCICILFLWSSIFPSWRVCWEKWVLQCMYVYIIPLITYFPNMEGVADINENCNVCMCILFPWSNISQARRGLLREMRVAMSVCVYYSFDHLFPQHGGGCWEKWELSCLCVYIIPLITYFPNMVGVAHRNDNCNVCMWILFPWLAISPYIEGDTERNESCNVCVCILFPWSHISQTWRGLLTEMRIAMSVCVYYSFDHLFSHHGGGCWEKWELRCLCVYIIPLITYFPKHGGIAHRNENCNVYVYIIPLTTYLPNMEGVAERNDNCNVCMCILFPWSPLSQTWRGCSQQWELQCIYVYYSLDHLFFRHGRGCWEKWELQCLYVYIIPLITYFPSTEGFAERNESCNVCVCILFPWSPISPNMEGFAHINENCNVCMCILFLSSPISPTWLGLLREMRIAMSVCVYYSLDHLIPQHGGVVHINENCNVYVYVIPLVTYFPKHGGVACINENCNVCMCILFLWSPISPTWLGLLREMRIAMSVCVYYYLDHLFPKHGGGCWEKWELQCLCVYIITLITYFPNMKGGGVLTEMRIPMSVYVFYSFDHLFFHHGGGCWEKWVLQCMYVYIIPLITYFPSTEGVAERNESCNVCVCILFLWSPISPTWRGLLREMRVVMSVCVYYSLDHIFPKHGEGCS